MSIDGKIVAGVRWLINASGQIVGYRNPVSDQDTVADFGGVGGGGAWGDITGTLSDQTDLQSALDAKAPTAAPSFTGVETHAGASILTAAPMAALAIDVDKSLNTKSISADSTLTFGAAVTVDQQFSLLLTNTDSSPHTITIPSSYSIAKQTAITTFVIPASARAYLTWRGTASTPELFGEPGYRNNPAATAAPAVTDDGSEGYGPLSTWLDATNNIAYVCESAAEGAAVWHALNSSSGTAPAAGFASAGRNWALTPLEVGSATWDVTSRGATAIDSSVAAGVSGLFATSYNFPRIQYTAAAAAANRGAGIRGGSAGLTWYPGGVRTANLKFRAAFAVADALTACRTACGFKTGGEPTLTVDPSAFTDCVFLGADAADTNMQIMHNDAAGACTKVDLGASFPANSNAADMYEVTFNFKSGASRSIDYTVTNLVSGAAASGTLTTDLPTAGTTANVFTYRNSAANTGAAVVIHVMGDRGGADAGVN